MTAARGSCCSPGRGAGCIRTWFPWRSSASAPSSPVSEKKTCGDSWPRSRAWSSFSNYNSRPTRSCGERAMRKEDFDPVLQKLLLILLSAGSLVWFAGLHAAETQAAPPPAPRIDIAHSALLLADATASDNTLFL